MSRVIRITLTHTIAGSMVISDPGGWADAVHGFERNQFHSITEYYKNTHSLYGSNGVEDSGRDWVKNIEKLYGPDSLIEALVEISVDDADYETVFSGQLPIESAIEILDFDHTMQMTFDPKGFWTTFKARIKTPVPIFGDVDLDGNAVTPLVPFDVNLSSQKVRANLAYFQGKLFDSGFLGYLTGPDYNVEIPVYDSTNNKNFITIDLDSITLDEIKQYYPTLLGASVELPPPNLIPIYDGDYTLDFKWSLTLKATVNSATGLHDSVGVGVYNLAHSRFRIEDTWTDWFLKIGNDPEIAFDKVADEAPGNGPFTDQWVTFSLSVTQFIAKGTPIRIYGKTYNGLGGNFGAGNNTFFVDVLQLVLLGKDNSEIHWPFTITDTELQFGTQDFDSHINVQADTVFPATVAPALLIHDLGAAIVRKITGVENSFFSKFLGRVNTLSRVYDENGCGSPYIDLKGLQLRGYNIIDKPPAMSFEEYWKIYEPLLNLGLGYKVIDGVDTVVVEEKASFYDSANVSIRLSNVKKIKKQWDHDYIYNRVEFGFPNGQDELTSGLDDPQSERTSATILKNIGDTLTVKSEGIAASLTIEDARRTTKEFSKDYKFDDKDFIIKVVEDGATFKPETTEGYNTVTNLLNWETRYNKDVTPMRMFIRWLNIASMGLQYALSSVFKFVEGTGNYDMVVNKDDGCLGSYSNADLREKQDIPVTAPLHFPLLYDIEHYLTYDQLRLLQAHPEYAIEISQTESNYIKFFLKVAEFKQSDGTFKLTAWPIEFFDIQYVDNDTHDYENPNPPRGRIFDRTYNKPFN